MLLLFVCWKTVVHTIAFPESRVRLKRASQTDGVDSSLLDGGRVLGRARKGLRFFADGRGGFSACVSELTAITSRARFSCRLCSPPDPDGVGGFAFEVVASSRSLRRGLRLRSLGVGGGVGVASTLDEAAELGFDPFGLAGPPASAI